VDGSSLSVLDTDSMVWETVRCGGGVPSARAGHAAAMAPSTSDAGWDLVVFGGGDGTRGFADLYRLDLTTLEWAKVVIPGDESSGLTPREGATCVSAGAVLVVYGGYTSTGCSPDTFTACLSMVGNPLTDQLLARPGEGSAAPDTGEESLLVVLASADAQEVSAAQEVFGRALAASVLGVDIATRDGEWQPVGHDETFGAALQRLELLDLALARVPEASPARRAAYLGAVHSGLLPVSAGGEERWFLFYWVVVQEVASGRRASAMSAGIQLSHSLVDKARESRFTESVVSLARKLTGDDSGDEVIDVQERLTHRLMTLHAQLTEAWYSAIGALLAEGYEVNLAAAEAGRDSSADIKQ